MEKQIKKIVVIFVFSFFPFSVFAETITFGTSGTASLSEFGTNFRHKVGVDFTTSAGGDFISTEICLKKVGSPSDNVVAQLETVSGSSPADDNLGSGSIAGASLGTTGTQETITFASPITLSASTEYFIVLYRSGSLDDSNYYIWCGTGVDVGSSKYAGSWVNDDIYDPYGSISTSAGSSSSAGSSQSATSTTATSTVVIANIGDITFGLAILIAISSLSFIGFIFNTLNIKTKKKQWQ